MPLKGDEVQEKLKAIKLFLFDLQGTLIPENDNGEIIPADLIEKLSEFGGFCNGRNMKCGIITGIENGKLLDAIKKLGVIELAPASLDKVSAAEKIAAGFGCSLDETFYMGDGILDVPLLTKAGLSTAPKSASRQIKKSVDFICPENNGAERLDYILSLMKRIEVET
ncbi:MAG: HAD hydrolase family protein [Chlorobi bacterium]|nr:HAD hydrolase family protein [Chlorobiota bacterium]